MARRVKIKDKNRIPQVVKALGKGGKVRAGVLGNGEMAQIAAVHEFGMTIHAKKNFMVIPLSPKYKGVDPKNFDLFFLRTKEGHNFLCKNVGKDRIEFCYMLVRSVTIPERSFIRGGWDSIEKQIMKSMDERLIDAVKNGVSMKAVLDAIGLESKGKMQKYARNLKSPANSKLTTSVKRSSNPLFDTGEMINSIDYKVEL